jgi:hypothetical protein
MYAPRPFPACLAALVSGLAFLFPTQGAATNSERVSSAGAVCQPANGGATAMFRRANQYLAHIGTSDQYVVCPLAVEDYWGRPTDTIRISVATYAETAGGTIACSVHNGRFANGATVGASVARSHTFASAGEAFDLVWEQNSIDVVEGTGLVLTCKLSPGMRLGSIDHTYLVEP